MDYFLRATQDAGHYRTFLIAPYKTTTRFGAILRHTRRLSFCHSLTRTASMSVPDRSSAITWYIRRNLYLKTSQLNAHVGLNSPESLIPSQSTDCRQCVEPATYSKLCFAPFLEPLRPGGQTYMARQKGGSQTMYSVAFFCLTF